MEGIQMSRFFLDTEFIEDGKTINLLSIALVHESGRFVYFVSSEVDFRDASSWVKTNVVPNIMRNAVGMHTRADIKREILSFVDKYRSGLKPEFWGYYADYDWVAFCQLFGKMIDLPKGWPMYCRDLKQFCDDLGNPKLPKNESHHALDDAQWIKEQYNHLIEIQYSHLSEAAIHE
jgi:hypothetical protein